MIDEINRGNLSKIFGELLLLIEHDKRRPRKKTIAESVPLGVGLERCSLRHVG